MQDEEQLGTSRASTLVLAVGEIRGVVKSLDDKVSALSVGMGKLTEAMAQLAKLEVHHQMQSKELDSQRQRIKELEEKIQSANLPSLVESRRWTIAAFGLALTAVGLGVLKLVLAN